MDACILVKKTFPYWVVSFFTNYFSDIALTTSQTSSLKKIQQKQIKNNDKRLHTKISNISNISP